MYILQPYMYLYIHCTHYTRTIARQVSTATKHIKWSIILTHVCKKKMHKKLEYESTCFHCQVMCERLGRHQCSLYAVTIPDCPTLSMYMYVHHHKMSFRVVKSVSIAENSDLCCCSSRTQLHFQNSATLRIRSWKAARFAWRLGLRWGGVVLRSKHLSSTHHLASCSVSASSGVAPSSTTFGRPATTATRSSANLKKSYVTVECDPIFVNK